MTSRKVALTILLFLIVGLTTTLFYVAINYQPETKTNTNLFAIMLEEDDGTYFESDLSTFPEDYIYNEEKTYCVNGASITWNNTTRTASVTADGSEKCYVYFDKLTTTFMYKSVEQKYIVPETGTYKIELWGASGGANFPGHGAYTSGIISLNEETHLYLYIGEKGYSGTRGVNETELKGAGGTATFNGGGSGGNAGGGSYPYSSYIGGASGGGATDVRLVNGDWNSASSLNSRIMVAGAGGGNMIGYTYDSEKGNAGGLISEKGGLTTNVYESYISHRGNNATQTTGFSLGIASNGANSGGAGYCNGHSGGGGGYYGGYGALGTSGSCFSLGGGGGTSYISGHTGAVAITSASNETPKSGCTTGTTNNACSTHYSGYKFTSTVMIDGAGYNWTNVKGSQVAMPNPLGGNYELGQGHLGNGYAKITLIK